MLQEIHIRDLGVITEATLDLHPGLTVLTGETGAGKTMVVTGLGLLLGNRADSALVRTGATRAVVEGVVVLPEDHPAMTRAQDAGGDVDEGALILVRSVGADGRSRAHVGGRTAPVGLLGELAEHLVAVHGQADQWRLRRSDQHREVVDRFGGPSLAAVLTAYRQLHADLGEAERQLATLRAESEERRLEAERLRIGLERIDALAPQPGEDVDLRVEDERLSHAEELRAAAVAAHTALAGPDEMDSGGEETSVLDLVTAARSRLQAVTANDPELLALETRLAEVGYLATDLAADLGSYLGSVDGEPGRLEWVQQRRAALAELGRAYGPSTDEVLQWSANAITRVLELDGTSDRIGDLEETVARRTSERREAAEALTVARTAAADELAARITDELGQLAMGSSRITIAVEPTGSFGADGADEVEIRLASGAGAPARSVTKAASGGELSRVMLAIEVATAGAPGARAEVPTFVFDEVDAGVGGRAALDVGARLAALASHAQVIVVTHLAQVAAHADRHLVVERSEDGRVTSSAVRAVTGEDRVIELARMLGGTDTTSALEHARDLLGRAAWHDGADVHPPPASPRP